MKTRDALKTFSGRTYMHGDGPLAQYAPQLLANFTASENARLAAADQRAAMAGRGPLLAVMQRRLAEARAADLFQDATPFVARFDAFQCLKQASQQYPTDRGLKMAAAHLERLWHKDAMGVLAIGDIARVRACYTQQYPRSVVAQVIDTELLKVGFNTLPVSKLAPLAAQIRGRTDEERQYAYEQVVRANGLGTNKPEHIRARAFIRVCAELAEEAPPEPTYGAQGGQGAAERALARMASYDDPILSRIAQGMPALPPASPNMPQGTMPAPGEDAPPGAESQIPHDEGSEIIEEAESPITGEPISIELGQVAPTGDPSAPPGGPGGPAGPIDAVDPGVVASLQYYGQLDQFGEDDPALTDGADPGGIDAFEVGGETSVTMEDPTAPGQMIDVIIHPAESATDMGAGVGNGAPAPMPGMDNQARRAGARRIFAVYAMRGGQRHPQPIERVSAASMPAMLRYVARNLAQADGSQRIARAVHADPQSFPREAFIVLDDSVGNYLYIHAEKDVFEPEMLSNGQPVVRHNLQLSPEDGSSVLVDKDSIGENVPGAGSTKSPTDGEPKAAKMTPAQAQKICARAGFAAKKIEDRLIAGEEIRVGKHALKLNDEADVEIRIGDRCRVASLSNLDRVIADFQALIAAPLAQKKRGSFEVRALFTVGCRSCHAVNEYVMPDRPLDIRCASCGCVTPSQAVAIQLEARQAAAFPGYLITADIPGDATARKLNAKRMLASVREVAKTDGAKIVQGRLEVAVRGAGEAEINRIRRVFADVFGVREMTAQQAPAPGLSPTSTGQHQTLQMAPSMPQAPTAPTYTPPAPAPIGGQAQQQFMADQGVQPGQPGQPSAPGQQPMQPQARRSTRLPVGPSIKHVQLRYADGRQAWTAIEASTDAMARSIIASHMDGTQVLAVVDSLARQAQLAGPPGMPGGAPPPPPGGAPGGAPGAGQMMMPGGGGGMPGGPGGMPGMMPPQQSPTSGPQNIEQASIDPKTEELIRAAMITFRSSGAPIDSAIDEVRKRLKAVLTQYGDDSSPARHLIGAAITRIAKEVFEQPALVNLAAAQQRLAHALTPFGARIAAEFGMRLGGDGPKGPQPKKINTQQDDAVKVPGAGEVLGADSQVGEGGFKNPKVNTQVDTIAQQPGTKKTPTDLGADSTPRDPKRFDAPMPPSDGHVFSGEGWGQSWSDKNIGSDTQTGDNSETGKWDGVSQKAPSTIRSK